VPFQTSAKGTLPLLLAALYPTATHELDDVHETEFRLAPSGEVLSGLASDQVDPFQVSANS